MRLKRNSSRFTPAPPEHDSIADNTLPERGVRRLKKKILAACHRRERGH